jgi:hypothetical protein
MFKLYPLDQFLVKKIFRAFLGDRERQRKKPIEGFFFALRADRLSFGAMAVSEQGRRAGVDNGRAHLVAWLIHRCNKQGSAAIVNKNGEGNRQERHGTNGTGTRRERQGKKR